MCRYSRFFVALVLFLITPALAVSPQGYAVSTQASSISEETSQLDTDLFIAYDDVLALINKAENGQLDEIQDAAQFEKIKHFLAMIAREGHRSMIRMRS